MPSQKILVIEDDLDDQLLISEAFQNSGVCCELSFAGNGRQALQILDSPDYRPDLIVLDLNMPVMNGFEVLSHFQAADTLASIPVIVLTTTGESDFVNKSYDLGASSFIVKPRTFPQLEKIARDLTNYWFRTVRLSSRGFS